VEQFDKEKRTVSTELEKLEPNAQHPDEMDSMQETYTESSKYEELIDKVHKTLKQTERMALYETNAISYSFEALKTKTQKQMKAHEKLISKENDAFKKKINDTVKALDKKTNMLKSELEKVKSKIKSFENETQLINKKVTAMSTDFNEHKKEIIKVEEAIGNSIKRLSNMHSGISVP
jgi:chromosome segregation ATPase